MMRSSMVLAIVCGLVACGGGDAATTATTSLPTASTGAAPSTTASSSGTDRGAEADPAEAIVQAATVDLADRLGVDEDRISLVSFEEVTWSDGSLGCPQPGMAYTQALVEGSKTVLEVDGTTYAYHAGGGQEPFLCESPVVDGGKLTTTVPGHNH